MSWLARSFVSSLRGGEDDDDDDDHSAPTRADYKSPTSPHLAEEAQTEGEHEQPGTPGRGVREDISELTKTLSRQFWGVASFLAPPPSAGVSPPSDPDPAAEMGSPRMAGIKSDFAEIGGRFRSGISMLSGNKAVSEISKIASAFLPFGSEEAAEEDEDDGEELGEERARDRRGAIGVTEEVLAFARNISMHPETWLDFPLLPDDDESDDFDMSDVQQEHALAVEHLAPRLAALRIELCPSHMSEGCFWKIYFVLLHPRLNKHDAELLSTPQIVEARAKLQELQSRRKQKSESSEGGVSYRRELLSPASPGEHVISPPSIPSETTTPRMQAAEEPTYVPVTEFETEKHPVVTTEVKIIDKSIIEEGPLAQTSKEFSGENSKIIIHKYDEDGDEWLQEDAGEMSGLQITPVPLGIEEDVSFSDLEEDDDQSVPKSSKMAIAASDSHDKGSRGWVQLNKSSGGLTDGNYSIQQTKESNDWSEIDDIDEV